MRGQPYTSPQVPEFSRIIPARAGPTPFLRPRPGFMPDHPRSCGANTELHDSGLPAAGSSPLVRGQHHFGRADHCTQRIIPARAGPTIAEVVPVVEGPDHPRSCGANHIASTFSSIGSGSSPLVRGQLRRFYSMRAGPWIIPARAGPTLPFPPLDQGVTDHPRSCGANICHRIRLRVERGSSPLVRGQPPRYRLRRIRRRIIPARAGPTSHSAEADRQSADHPRSCGANGCRCSVCGYGFGSSPLVRGQPHRRDWHVHHLRIIPARAGPTSTRPSTHTVPTDHPRSCGANLATNAGPSCCCGSSPLVRGQHDTPTIWSVRWRIIPARAGPTRRVRYTC